MTKGCDCVKKLIALLLALACVSGLAGCGSSREKHTIEIIIPAGSTDPFVYSDEEISPKKNTLTISAGAGISTTEVILKTVEVKEKTAYEPETLKQKGSVKMDVEKGAWFKIGVAIQNPADVPISVAVIVEDADIRIANKETEPQTEPAFVPVLDRESLEAACAEGFMDPSKVTVLGGEWAYTADPDKFVALAMVEYTDKDDEYETAEFLMLGVFGGEIELYHILNEHSPYTRENALQEFGAIDSRRFPLE